MDDEWFEDEVEGILNNFFTPRRIKREYNYSNEEEERIIDFIETKNKVFFIFELPGYEEKDLDLDVKENKIIVSVKKKGDCQAYLKEKLCVGERIIKNLPLMAGKKYDFTFNNGILEVSFDKK